ncbi:MAG: hypothetical protein PHT31_06480 [Candidatus Omnitrophica bacterium]|nr:hypothetical protein [Candidatus Omnitrophota bacterium]MDD5653782.1 hypothetical protein [Candidatus Omnitrophota bacterium]
MVKNVDHSARKRAVLAAAINQHIEDAEPVASEDIARDFDLSSATIRNIFAELEGEGYLTHPHTSGGRIPTSRGYRYYVDFLLSQIELLDKEKEQIIGEYRREINEMEGILEKTSEVISVITHYAGLVSFLEREDRFFYKGISFVLEQPEFQDLTKMRLIVKMMEDKKRILNIINRDFSGKVKIYIGEELEEPQIQECSLIVSSFKIKDRPTGRLAVLGPKRMEYQHAIPALEYVSDILSAVLEKI